MFYLCEPEEVVVREDLEGAEPTQVTQRELTLKLKYFPLTFFVSKHFLVLCSDAPLPLDFKTYVSTVK